MSGIKQYPSQSKTHSPKDTVFSPVSICDPDGMNSGCAGSSSRRNGVNSGTSGSMTADGLVCEGSASPLTGFFCVAVAVAVSVLVGLVAGEGEMGEGEGRLLADEDEGRSLDEVESFGID